MGRDDNHPSTYHPDGACRGPGAQNGPSRNHCDGSSNHDRNGGDSGAKDGHARGSDCPTGAIPTVPDRHRSNHLLCSPNLRSTNHLLCSPYNLCSCSSCNLRRCHWWKLCRRLWRSRGFTLHLRKGSIELSRPYPSFLDAIWIGFGANPLPFLYISDCL